MTAKQSSRQTDALAETTPTSMAGVFALLQLQRELYDTNTMDLTADQMGHPAVLHRKGHQGHSWGRSVSTPMKIENWHRRQAMMLDKPTTGRPG